MVDLAEIQSVYYMIAATGVLVAVFYNILNMRETARNRRVAFTTNLVSTITSKQGLRDWYDLMQMQWVDFDDFKRKYDSSVNPENFINRLHFWNVCNHVGWQLKAGLVDWDTLRQYGDSLRNLWLKYRPIIEEYRKMQYNSDAYEDWEYLADRMEDIISVEDRKKSESLYGTYRH